MSRSRFVLTTLTLTTVATLAACADGADRAALTAPASQPLLSSSSGSGNGTKEIDLRDDCDSASFNAAIGAGTCVKRGSVTLTKFMDELTKTRKVGSWKNNPDKFDAKVGTTLAVHNIGGEAHTFTRVANFGGGILTLLNQLSGNTTVAPECLTQTAATTVAAGGHVHIPTGGATGLTAGTYRFQCCLHPWMRTTATLKRS